ESLFDFFREWPLQHPARNGVDRLGFATEIAVGAERLARTGLGRLAAADGDEFVARREPRRRGVRSVLAAVLAVVHEEQRRLDLGIVEAAQRRRLAPRARAA